MLLACWALASSVLAHRDSSAPLIIPRPKETSWVQGCTSLPHNISIVCGRSHFDRAAAAAFARQLAIDKKAIRYWPPQSGQYVVFGEPSRRWVRSILGHDARKIPRNAQGYFLSTKPKGRILAVVAGRTPEGTLYGAETLCQMVSHNSLCEGEVRDWPSLSWRGVLLFLGNHALHFHKKLITNVLTRFKINSLMLECEQVKWDATKGSWPDWGMTKSDLSQELSYAYGAGLNVLPLVNTVGHMRWLLLNPRFKHLSEDPDHPSAICPTDPETYPLLFRLYDEVLKTFHTPSLHFGGDELNYAYRYPWRSKKVYPTLSDGFIAHTGRLIKWLKQRGVQPMLWDDMLIAKDEALGNTNAENEAAAEKTRKAIPKDVLMFDWFYAEPGNATRIAVLRKAGFRNIIGSSWLSLAAIQETCQALTNAHCLGHLQTTWIGYNSQEKNLHSYESNFSAFIVAADEAWNGGSIPIDRLGYSPAKVLRQAYAMPLSK